MVKIVGNWYLPRFCLSFSAIDAMGGQDSKRSRHGEEDKELVARTTWHDSCHMHANLGNDPQPHGLYRVVKWGNTIISFISLLIFLLLAHQHSGFQTVNSRGSWLYGCMEFQ